MAQLTQPTLGGILEDPRFADHRHFADCSCDACVIDRRRALNEFRIPIDVWDEIVASRNKTQHGHSANCSVEMESTHDTHS